jgi:outer membrane biosynthesis protein TonB
MSQSQSLTSARRLPTTTRQSESGIFVAVVVAVVLHAAILLAVILSFGSKFEAFDVAPPVVPVDLVNVADKANVAPTVQRVEPKPAEEVTPPPQPVAPPAPQEADVAPEPVPSQPVVPKPEPLPKPMMKPQPTPPAPAPPKPKADDFGALLDKLTKPAASPRDARVADRTMKGVGAMNAANTDLAAALKNQIYSCWTVPANGPHPDQLIVTFRLFLNPDGSVAQAPQLSADSASAAASDPYMRAAAEAARRAIYTCAPYKLPADKYAIWRDSTVVFVPREKME